MAGLETEIVQQQQPQLTPAMAEKDRPQAPTEAILPILPFDKAILMIIAKYPIPMVARLGTSLPEVVAEEMPIRFRVGRLSRGRRGSRGLSRRHSSRRCGVCEDCRNSRGSFVRGRCRGGMFGFNLTGLDN